MSYDLYLSSPRLNQAAFNRHFAGRRHYESPAWYRNEDTGVYFSFAYVEAGGEDAPVDGDHVAFNLNYCRPHVFGLEAEPEVSAFVQAFGCTILDPQMDGMGEGPYSPAGFLRGWNRGNAFSYELLGAKGGLDQILIVDEVRIEQVWRWNLMLAQRRAEAGEDRFLPHVTWAKRLSDGAAIAFAVWGEGVMWAFPDCATHVLLMRRRTVRKGWFTRKATELVDAKLVPMATIRGLDGCGRMEAAGEPLWLAPLDLPPSPQVMSLFVQGFADQASILERYPPDHVLGDGLMAGGARRGA